MKRLVIFAFLASLLPATAFAHMCPSVMAEIDTAIETASLSEEDMTKVKDLRARGEEEHQAGDHDASMATLGEAKEILGL